jgi:hypothetical protein
MRSYFKSGGVRRGELKIISDFIMNIYLIENKLSGDLSPVLQGAKADVLCGVDLAIHFLSANFELL